MEGGGGGLSLTLDGKATLKPSSSGTTNCTANNFCYWLRLFFIMVFGIFHLKVQHFDRFKCMYLQHFVSRSFWKG